MRLVKLTALSNYGRLCIDASARRMPRWDGKTWRVVQERSRVAFSSADGPWLHLIPHTSDHTDWAGKWVHANSDHFAVKELSHVATEKVGSDE